MVEKEPSKDVPSKDVAIKIEDDQNIKTQSDYTLTESKNQSNEEESCNINDPIDLQEQFNSNLHKDNDDDKTDVDNKLYNKLSSNNAQLAQNLSISNRAEVNTPPTYPLKNNNNIIDSFYDLR